MTSDKFYFTVPIEILCENGVPDRITGRWEQSVEGTPSQCYGVVHTADDGEPELPGFIVSAIENALGTEQGQAWMLNQMQEMVR